MHTITFRRGTFSRPGTRTRKNSRKIVRTRSRKSLSERRARAAFPGRRRNLADLSPQYYCLVTLTITLVSPPSEVMFTIAFLPLWEKVRLVKFPVTVGSPSSFQPAAVIC